MKNENSYYLKNHNDLNNLNNEQTQLLDEMVTLIRRKGYTKPEPLAYHYLYRTHESCMDIHKGYNGLSDDEKQTYKKIISLWDDFIDNEPSTIDLPV